MNDHMLSLPSKGILFLGGHQNMIKKLRLRFPHWRYASDDQFKTNAVINQEIVFYWTKHSSHKLMRYIYSKLPNDSKIYFVSTTNLVLLEKEMIAAYQSHLFEKQRVARMGA